MVPSGPDASYVRALAERAKNALDTLGSWENESEIYEATMMAIADVQEVVKESGESALGWGLNSSEREDVFAFLETAREHIRELRSSRKPVLDRFSLNPHLKTENERYQVGGSARDKITRNMPLSILLQTALIAHMVIFARASGSIKGTIFQNPKDGELPDVQKRSRDRYIEGMLAGIVENLNILGGNSGDSRRAAVNTMVRHLPELTDSFMSGVMIREVLNEAGGKYSELPDQWIEKEFKLATKLRILIKNPASLHEAILAVATARLFLDDPTWLQEQLKGASPRAKGLVLACIRNRPASFQAYRSEHKLLERVRKLEQSAELFADEAMLKKELETKYQITYTGSLTSTSQYFLSCLLEHIDSLKFFAEFLRGKPMHIGGYETSEIRSRLAPREV